MNLNTQDIKTIQLADLCKLWGFLKYHHPIVATGKYNMDDELIKTLHIIFSSENSFFDEIIENWFDSFESIPETNLINEGYSEIAFFNLNLNFQESFINKLKYTSRFPIKNHFYFDILENGNVLLRNEINHISDPFTDTSYRLLILYRYWNAINYFYPYKYLIDEDWEAVLYSFIPKFIETHNWESYIFLLHELVSKIDDSHSVITGKNPFINKIKGDLVMPFQMKYIEDKIVVTDYYNHSPQLLNVIKIGDIIEKINDVSITELVEKYLTYTSGSNKPAKLKNLLSSDGFLSRSNKSIVKITLRRNGIPENIFLNKIKYSSDMRQLDCKTSKINEAIKILENNILYIYPEKIKENDLDIIAQKSTECSGIIIDFRCYPSLFLPFFFGKLLKPNESEFAHISRCNKQNPGEFIIFLKCINGYKNIHFFKGKVIVLVNALTQSAAEHCVMAISTAPNVEVVGSTTAGANGNTSYLNLGNDIYTAFTGSGVYYPDKTEVQRTGVKIDKYILVTIRGIIEDKDELLEKAIEIIHSYNDDSN